MASLGRHAPLSGQRHASPRVGQTKGLARKNGFDRRPNKGFGTTKVDKIEDIMYFINDGVYGSFNCILYDHHVAAPQYLLKNGDKLHKSSVWGPTCDGLDQICSNVLLPKLDIGDIILFENMGAYTLPIASPFNGFPLPRVKFYINEKDEFISSVI